jgi:hypothetical protein
MEVDRRKRPGPVSSIPGGSAAISLISRHQKNQFQPELRLPRCSHRLCDQSRGRNVLPVARVQDRGARQPKMELSTLNMSLIS